MKLAQSIVLAAATLALAAHADTRSGDKDGATMERKAPPSDPAKKRKSSASAGSSKPTSAVEPLTPERERAFRLLDIDGDGAISKAEAAGNAPLITAFDRADRNNDGKLSPAEYGAIGKAQERRARASARAAAK